VHSVAPFYSVLIRVNTENPADITHFVCNLCNDMPQPTDEGKTYTFYPVYVGAGASLYFINASSDSARVAVVPNDFGVPYQH
jgi:hypothetical protein